MNKIETAVQLHQEHCSCAQCILVAYCDELGIDAQTAYKLGDGIGGGFGKMRNLCGALNAMGIVIGSLNSGTLDQKGLTKEKSMAEVRKCTEKFVEKNGSLLCGELLATNSDDRTCDDLVRDCAEIINEYIEERKKEELR